MKQRPKHVEQSDRDELPDGRPAGRRPPRLHDAQRPRRLGGRHHRAARRRRRSRRRRPPRRRPPAAEGHVSPDLDVVKKAKGPVMTTGRRVLQGRARARRARTPSGRCGSPTTSTSAARSCRRSSSPRRPGSRSTSSASLSATGQGPRHGARLARRHHRQGAGHRRPAVPRRPARQAGPGLPGEAGRQDFDVSLKDVVYDAPKGDFPHPNTMTCKLMAGDTVLLEQEYYSVGGGFIEWKGYEPPKKGQPKYPYATMKELLAHVRREQDDGRAGRDGQRGGGLRQERGRGQRVPRQDLGRDGRDREVRPRDAAGSAARARSS